MDIENLVLQRVSQIEDEDEDLEVNYGIEEADYGVIVVADEGEPIGFEFVESETSWMRPDALTQYHELAQEGYYVAVIVPEEAYLPVLQLVYSLGEVDISVLTYRSLDMIPTPMAS